VTQADNDVIMEIFSVRNLLCTSLVPVVVKQCTTSNPPSLYENIQEEAQYIAYTYAEEGPPLLPIHPKGETLPFHIISIQLHSKTFQDNPHKPIASTVFQRGVKVQIITDTKWDMTTLNGMDWSAMERALHNCPRPARVKYTKIMFELNQANYLNNKYYNTTPNCPCCNAAIETFKHVLSCDSDSVKSLHQSTLETLTQALVDIFTPIQNTQSILSQLSLDTVPVSGQVPDSVLQASSAQDAIG
jgi:hypothetical protein